MHVFALISCRIPHMQAAERANNGRDRLMSSTVAELTPHDYGSNERRSLAKKNTELRKNLLHIWFALWRSETLFTDAQTRLLPG